MAAVQTPRSGAIELATNVQTVLAASKLRLWVAGFAPTVTTTKAEFVAEEADFSGYPAGGITITAFADPILDPNGGASINGGVQQFVVVTATPIVPNSIGGWWLEDSAGVVWYFGALDSPKNMQVVGDGLPLSITLGYGQPAA